MRSDVTFRDAALEVLADSVFINEHLLQVNAAATTPQKQGNRPERNPTPTPPSKRPAPYANNNSAQWCIQFQKGLCRMGSNCRCRHSDNPPRAPKGKGKGKKGKGKGGQPQQAGEQG